MHKNNFYLLGILFLGIIISSCHKLSLEPKGILGEPELFGNEFGVTKYFAGLYNKLPIEDFNYFGTNGSGFGHGNYWEAGKFSQGNMSGEFFNTWASVNNGGFGYWPYGEIRNVNVFLENFQDYKENYGEADFNRLLGEAHFLRAFFYFGLVKRYGGVPIVSEVQNPLGDADSLKVSRNTEYECWKFIHDDLQFAIDNLGEKSERGRANRYVAAALMSRAMLYAGSSAKYSQYLSFGSEEASADGLAGMQPDQAGEFFQYCVDAGKVIDGGPYKLYDVNPDKAENFANLFLDVNSSENIFTKGYNINAPNNTLLRHNYDALMSPNPDMSTDVGAESYPSLDFMQLYDMPELVDGVGRPVRFDNKGDIKNNMEPRMRGTMYFSGDELRGVQFDIQRGIYRTFNGLASDAQEGSNNAPINDPNNRILGGRGWTTDINGQTLNITGRHGNFEDQGGENNCFGIAYIRKYINPAMSTSDVQLYRSDQEWIVFRLGEIYLNSAEALYELGERDKAFDLIEKIRVRAGSKIARPLIDQTLTNVATINSAQMPYQIEKSLQFIRDERVRELYGENHWWWDLRRWRIADVVLRQFRPNMLSCYYVANEDKYIYLEEINRINRDWSASRSCYFEPIPAGEINKNNNLLPQNPLW